MIRDLLDLDRYPIDPIDSPEGERLIDRCKADMAAHGMFNLEDLVKPGVTFSSAGRIGFYGRAA
jgi:hypothetical protein